MTAKWHSRTDSETMRKSVNSRAPHAAAVSHAAVRTRRGEQRVGLEIGPTKHLYGTVASFWKMLNLFQRTINQIPVYVIQLLQVNITAVQVYGSCSFCFTVRSVGSKMYFLYSL